MMQPVDPADRPCAPGGAAPEEGAAPGLVPPALDFEQLRDSTLGDPVFGRELAAIFIQQTEEQLAAMSAALAQEDACALRAFAHRLKGGALALGALRLCAEVAGLEETAERGDLAAAQPRLAAVRSALQEVHGMLDAYFQAPTP